MLGAESVQVMTARRKKSPPAFPALPSSEAKGKPLGVVSFKLSDEDTAELDRLQAVLGYTSRNAVVRAWLEASRKGRK